MNRTPRIQHAGHLYHVISRFEDHEFRLDGPEARARYLAYLGRGLESTDTRIAAFALMSTHLHLGPIAGERKISDLIQRVNTAYALWVNRRDGRLGSVIVNRPTIVDVNWRPVHAIAYIHNNPVRAGLVAHAADSTWTSHRAYLGLEPAPAWLQIDEGLRRCALPTTAAGRQQFDQAVRALEREGRDPTLSDEGPSYARRMIHQQAGSPILEVGTPAWGRDGVEWPVLRRVISPEHERKVEAIVQSIAVRFGVVDWKSRSFAGSRAKQLLFYVACVEFGLPPVAIYTRIDMSRSRASEVLDQARRSRPSEAHVALVLADVGASLCGPMSRTG